MLEYNNKIKCKEKKYFAVSYMSCMRLELSFDMKEALSSVDDYGTN